MSIRNRRPRVTEVEAGQIAWAALAGCVVAILLASVVGAAAFVRTLDIAPQVGDILVFRPAAHLETDWEVAARRPDGGSGCVLRPDVMSVQGGSLVVEERAMGSRAYRVHWAGPRTAMGISSCGDDADLLVARGDLQLLINVVGGVGVQPKMFASY
jgi:hypothetical protein